MTPTLSRARRGYSAVLGSIVLLGFGKETIDILRAEIFVHTVAKPKARVPHIV